MEKVISVAVVAAYSYMAWHSGQLHADGHRTLPAVIVCSVSGKQNFAYLSAIEADGTARYMTLTGAFAEVGPDNLVKRAQSQAAGDCAGKTIDQLRGSGQTREFAQ